MLSLHQAQEIQASIEAYLEATFNFQEAAVHRAFYDWVRDSESGMFRGPYVSLKLPFVQASTEEAARIPLTIKPTSWTPYDHQVRAWERLSSAEQQPQPTLITTGTGSGKTESFMYPILDYCYRKRHERGVKVVILYPMNALATDQAKRLAEAIYEDERLRGQVTAGLFIGEGSSPKEYPSVMGATHIIENRRQITQVPPDILLTNFKMLDYGLMKGEYDSLWQHNYRNPRLLQYLVLDELHTYDGAQGTDVANLIRRLKYKLGLAPRGQLCAVGTSATLGSDTDAQAQLASYASSVFGEAITPECIIRERRVTVTDFFPVKRDEFAPRTNVLTQAQPLAGEQYDAYVARQRTNWQLPSGQLAAELKHLEAVHDLVKALQSGTGYLSMDELVAYLRRHSAAFRRMSADDSTAAQHIKWGVLSLLALISEAQQESRTPFLYLQVQLWVRELSGILRLVDTQPQFIWKSDADHREDGKRALPPWFCRECGTSGWIAVRIGESDRLVGNAAEIYDHFFKHSKDLYFILPTATLSVQQAKTEVGYTPSVTFEKYVSMTQLNLLDKADEGYLPISGFSKFNKKGGGEHVCPACNSRDTLAIMGTRTATLSSIAVSQSIASDLDPTHLRDRKVLAFTNAVQDAAHQAGFIEVRNYRFTFRASLQRIVNQLQPRPDAPVSLATLASTFVAYWKDAAYQGDPAQRTPQRKLEAYFTRFFPNDLIGKVELDSYKTRKGFQTAFETEFDRRMHWEVYSEFGYNALIGRTLEKTQSSATYFADTDLQPVWERISAWLTAQDEQGLFEVEMAVFMRFIRLVLHRIRTRGGITHDYLEKYRLGRFSTWELNWQRDDRHFLNRKFGGNRRLPRLLTPQKDKTGVLDSTHTQANNWFHQYFKKSFDMGDVTTDFLNEFYEELIGALHQADVLDKRTSDQGIESYTLNPAKVYILPQTTTYQCRTCESKRHTAALPEEDWGDASCMYMRCTGRYTPKPLDITGNYYQQVYNRDLVPRIYAKEHTGLLPREDREQLERDFKQREQFNSTNVMVATSTLEMGIDIGSLNVAFNNAVPPRVANFLQRVGRAGRKSGSALIVNFVTNQDHDLYYYEAPTSMMAGEVSTPGCFLAAKEILRRHFFAFCLDSWTREDPMQHSIPSQIRVLKLLTSDPLQAQFFMTRLLTYIQKHEQGLFQQFSSGYTSDDIESALEALRQELQEHTFYDFYAQLFVALKTELQDIHHKMRGITKEIEGLKLGKKDQDYIELNEQRYNLSRLSKSINSRSTLEHLTNAGALPNYAFPETGVSLFGEVVGRRQGDAEPFSKSVELVRSAKQAIREFAPENYFYAQGYRFKVDQINTSDWKDELIFHKKRFCSNCDHIAPETLAPKGNCPKCQHESWGSAANVHSFAKMLNMRSYNSLQDAKLNDSKEIREQQYYSMVTHYNFKDAQSSGALAIKAIPFGISFDRNVKITVSNCGSGAATTPNKVTMNEVEVPVHGFVTCKRCGKSTNPNTAHRLLEQQPGTRNPFHVPYCKDRDRVYEGQSDDVFEEVFLFREMTTEVLKVLLPYQEVNPTAEYAMYKAGLTLGLRHFFGGNPDHISIESYREYNAITGKFDQYLLMVDNVPGGTGYLERLFDPRVFKQLLERSFEQLNACACQYKGEPGCYRCIYSYDNRHHRGSFTREAAAERFKHLLDQKEELTFQETSLSDLNNHGHVEESELERWFIDSLKALPRKAPRYHFEETRHTGTVEYRFAIKRADGTVHFRILPQVELGRRQGIERNTRPDFLVEYIQYSGLEVTMQQLDPAVVPKVAIYLDGYQYHASSQHNRFAEDVERRRAVLAHDNYLTWTLTWDDLVRFDAWRNDQQRTSTSIPLDDWLTQQRRSKDLASQVSKVEQYLITLFPELTGYDDRLATQTNQVSKLLCLLTYLPMNSPKGSVLQASLTELILPFQANFLSESYPPTDVKAALRNEGRMNFLRKPNLSPSERVNVAKLNTWLPLSLNAQASDLAVWYIAANPHERSLAVHCSLKETQDIDKAAWQRFWEVFNLMQLATWHDRLTEEDTTVSEGFGWADIEVLFEDDVELLPLLRQLYDRGQLQSDADIDRVTTPPTHFPSGFSALLFLEDKKLIVGPGSEAETQEATALGYRVVTVDQINTIVL